MNTSRLEILLDKYGRGLCSCEELTEINEWLGTIGENESLQLPDYIKQNIHEYLEKKYKELMLLKAKRKLKERRLLLYKVAAILLVFISVGTALPYLVKKKKLYGQPLVVMYRVENNHEGKRYFKLPDSSVVILHTGSTLKLERANFNNNIREVVLNGEAYFDIHHEENRPFVIHTGNLKVTVLGTAFNIKQNKDSIAVTVTRGKVKVEVEGERKMLTILTPHQQVVYNIQRHNAIQQEVSAPQEVKWINVDFTFNGESLDSIARQLEDRYGVSIVFANKSIAKCQISVVNPFAGTESVDEILSLICPAINATFKMHNNIVTIDGHGCGAKNE